jgi:hypothetical protein
MNYVFDANWFKLISLLLLFFISQRKSKKLRKYNNDLFIGMIYEKLNFTFLNHRLIDPKLFSIYTRILFLYI